MKAAYWGVALGKKLCLFISEAILNLRNTHKKKILKLSCYFCTWTFTLHPTVDIDEPLRCQHSTSNLWSIQNVGAQRDWTFPVSISRITGVEKQKLYHWVLLTHSVEPSLSRRATPSGSHMYKSSSGFEPLNSSHFFVVVDGKGLCIINAVGVSWGGRSWKAAVHPFHQRGECTVARAHTSNVFH